MEIGHCLDRLSLSKPNNFPQVWDDLKTRCHDEASQFVRLLSKGEREYLVEGDFKNLIQDVIDTHPGMTFLDDAPEFHARWEYTIVISSHPIVGLPYGSRNSRADMKTIHFR